MKKKTQKEKKKKKIKGENKTHTHTKPIRTYVPMAMVAVTVFHWSLLVAAVSPLIVVMTVPAEFHARACSSCELPSQSDVVYKTALTVYVPLLLLQQQCVRVSE